MGLFHSVGAPWANLPRRRAIVDTTLMEATSCEGVSWHVSAARVLDKNVLVYVADTPSGKAMFGTVAMLPATTFVGMGVDDFEPRVVLVSACTIADSTTWRSAKVSRFTGSIWDILELAAQTSAFLLRPDQANDDAVVVAPPTRSQGDAAAHETSVVDRWPWAPTNLQDAATLKKFLTAS